MEAKIKEKKEIANGTLLVTYDLLGQKPEFKAGQYFFVTLPNLHYQDERGNRRHFSIVNSPNEKGILTMATRLTDSGFKKTLKELELGSRVNVGPIAGLFVLPQITERPLVFIAGGIGITPFMSMLKFVKEENLPIKITLIYSNKDQNSTAFLEDLKDLERENHNLKLVLTMTSDSNWNQEKRRIDSQFIKDYSSNLNNPFYYVVGPPLMVEAIVEALNKAGVSNIDIKIENFTGY